MRRIFKLHHCERAHRVGTRQATLSSNNNLSETTTGSQIYRVCLIFELFSWTPLPEASLRLWWSPTTLALPTRTTRSTRSTSSTTRTGSSSSAPSSRSPSASSAGLSTSTWPGPTTSLASWSPPASSRSPSPSCGPEPPQQVDRKRRKIKLRKLKGVESTHNRENRHSLSNWLEYYF